jgi:hypothetical protein
MLRDLVQAGTAILLVCAAILTGLVPAAWPFLACMAVLAVGVFYERVFYRGAVTPRGADWQATAERFRDQESGEMVTVWFNAKTGERRYVEDDSGKAG